ncbi:Uncharacterized protein APZ42_027179 [Daphnia magna]|uniref:Uncharacterized protein n=1 Tax=Daphnia magna TaxID=35525 RepID=A0A164RBP5_9CRUS|nr:Uncharacterized protein APZ42_027179 [Daphnia magna]
MFRIATRRSRRHCSNGCVPSSGMTTRSCLTFTCPFSVCIPLAPQLVFLCLSARMLQESRSFLLVSSFVSIFNILLLFYLFFSISVEVTRHAAARKTTAWLYNMFAHFALLAGHLFLLRTLV